MSDFVFDVVETEEVRSKFDVRVNEVWGWSSSRGRGDRS